MSVFVVADHIITPLGDETRSNWNALAAGKSGIGRISDEGLFPEMFYGARLAGDATDAFFAPEERKKFTTLEKLLIRSVQAVLRSVPGINTKKLLLIVSTTKGNIDLLAEPAENIGPERLQLASLARTINDHIGLPHPPVVVSNACISGVSAIITGRRMIAAGLYDHVLVTGGDILSEFVLSGFQCLKALDGQPCRPYDARRNGISLGEACGSLLLSRDPGLCDPEKASVIIRGFGQSNDANHISGPSRTGEGLKIAVKKALQTAGIDKENIGYLNAHGTATLFNDEMEAIAFDDLGLSHVPLNSLKGYFGHTLGAAGIIETIMAIHQLGEGLLVKSLGYENSGVSRNLQVLPENRFTEAAFLLKTASGFGGCNAALILEKT